MSNLYRESALERISSPEQLDKEIVITSPMSWLALATATVIVVAVLIWSIVGTIPISVSASGIVASPVSTNAIYATESGIVTSALVSPGTSIHIGDPVLTYKTGNGQVQTLTSDQEGKVTNVFVQTDGEISQGNEVLRVSPIVKGKQVVVCFTSIQEAKRIKRGMEAKIYLSSANSQTYGHMVARVANVDSYVSSAEGLSYILGKDNNMQAVFQEDRGAIVAITCELDLDNTVSGYYWSNKKGKSIEVTNGTIVNAKITLEKVHPISKLFSSLHDR